MALHEQGAYMTKKTTGVDSSPDLNEKVEFDVEQIALKVHQATELMKCQEAVMDFYYDSVQAEDPQTAYPINSTHPSFTDKAPKIECASWVKTKDRRLLNEITFEIGPFFRSWLSTEGNDLAKAWNTFSSKYFKEYCQKTDSSKEKLFSFIYQFNLWINNCLPDTPGYIGMAKEERVKKARSLNSSLRKSKALFSELNIAPYDLVQYNGFTHAKEQTLGLTQRIEEHLDNLLNEVVATILKDQLAQVPEIRDSIIQSASTRSTIDKSRSIAAQAITKTLAITSRNIFDELISVSEILESRARSLPSLKNDFDSERRFTQSLINLMYTKFSRPYWEHAAALIRLIYKSNTDGYNIRDYCRRLDDGFYLQQLKLSAGLIASNTISKPYTP